MKIIPNMILVTLVLSILITPLVEVFMLGRDRILLSSTLYNSFRAAKEIGYYYTSMRNMDAEVDEEVFLKAFAETFAVSYGMDCRNTKANPLRFVSPDNTFNDFIVDVDFKEVNEGSNITTIVTITAESEYRFRTRYSKLFNFGATDPYLLTRTRTFIMRVKN